MKQRELTKAEMEAEAELKAKAEQLKRNEAAKPLLGTMSKMASELSEIGFDTEARLVNRIVERLDATIKGLNYLDEKRKRMRARTK